MLTDFVSFLKVAKAATYAAQGDLASVQPLLGQTKQLEFTAGDYFYRDIYAGMNFFVGQEMVYLKDKPIWSMAYSGGLLIDCTGAAVAEIYSFLRESLRHTPAKLPVRGPHTHRRSQLVYRCQITGDIDRFVGTETIELAGSQVYDLAFSGGWLK